MKTQFVSALCIFLIFYAEKAFSESDEICFTWVNLKYTSGDPPQKLILNYDGTFVSYILGEVNQRISSRSLDAMTTAVVVAYYSQESEARISYAGHPPVLYRRANDKEWSYARSPGRKGHSDGFPLNIPLAVDLDTLYGQLTISMIPGDRLFVYTDGIIDAPSPEGESFGLARLKDVLDENEGAPLSELKSAVFRTLHQYTEKELIHDDVTLIALEIC